MPLLDQFLALIGTNRTRMQWKLRAWRRAWDRRTSSFKNRTQALTYAHQVCPRCSHPAGADERVCTRCGEALGGRVAHQARRLATMVWGDAPFVATVITAAILALYLAPLVWANQVGIVRGVSLSPHSLALFRFGSLVTTSVQDGEWWRLGTSTFLHLHPLHLVMNLMSLWSVATYLEPTLGKAKTLALYLGLGFTSSAASFLWYTNTPPYAGNSAGASGAICGLIGVCIGFSLRKRNVARHMVSHYIGWAVWIAILGFSSWNIDNAGHLGGLVPGFLLGLVVRRRNDTAAAARRIWTYAAFLLAGVTIATIVLASGHPLPDEWIAAALSPSS